MFHQTLWSEQQFINDVHCISIPIYIFLQLKSLKNVKKPPHKRFHEGCLCTLRCNKPHTQTFHRLLSLNIYCSAPIVSVCHADPQNATAVDFDQMWVDSYGSPWVPPATPAPIPYCLVTDNHHDGFHGGLRECWGRGWHDSGDRDGNGRGFFWFKT